MSKQLIRRTEAIFAYPRVLVQHTCIYTVYIRFRNKVLPTNKLRIKGGLKLKFETMLRFLWLAFYEVKE